MFKFDLRLVHSDGGTKMRSKSLGITLLAAALMLLFAASNSQAFHSGGVAECSGCHSMHAPKAGGSFLLVGTDPSSTCLSCHQNAADTGPSSYHISTAEAGMPVGVVLSHAALCANVFARAALFGNGPGERRLGWDHGAVGDNSRRTFSSSKSGTMRARRWLAS